MAYLSEYEYYANNGNTPEGENWGSYQYVSLEDIVNNFELMYAGNHSLVNNEPRYKILFHAKRAIQELNYDAFKEMKVLELAVDDSLRFILPADFVNWVRISQLVNGVLLPLNENVQTNTAKAYLQDHTGRVLFDHLGNALSPQNSDIDFDRIQGLDKTMYMDGTGSQFNGMQGYNHNGDWYFDMAVGGRIGMNTATANANPTFTIDKKAGVINFSSAMSDAMCILEYVSDGMEGGDDSSVSVNKLFEAYIYAAIEAEIIGSKLNVQEYVVRRAKKKKRALLMNAKIRISNMHPSRLLQSLRGKDKWLK